MISIVSVVVLASAFVCVSANEIRRDPNLLSGVVVNDADRKTVGEGPEPYPETPSHNLSNEISQSSYSRRRRLTPISCDSVDNGICSTSSTITLASEGIFGPSGLLFNGAVVESSVKSLVIQSTVECTGVLCKMTFQDFDLLQISGTGSILGSDILLDVNTLLILQGGMVSGTARGHPEGQGPSPGFFTCLSSSAFGGSHGGKSGYWYLPTNELYFYEAYGSETFPADFGSGGTDSSGGGRISVYATVKVEVDGTISEDGGGCIATSGCGSAAGGSIYIASEEVQGTGRISANGGALASHTTDNAASGGGGRIAIYTNKESLGLTISASGGSLNSNPLPVHTQGESGTIFRDKFQSNSNTSPVPYPADSPAEFPTTPSPTPVPTEGTTDATSSPTTPSPTPVPTEGTTDATSSGTTAMNPCTICPNGVTAGYDEYAPWAVTGDPTTCAELIDAAKLYEAGSEDCALAEGDQIDCCFTKIENPCIICPKGATVGDDYVLPGYEGTELTCADLIGVATMYETESSWCAVYGERDESLCCPPVTSAPNSMPVNDTTVAPPMTSSTNVTPSPVEPLTTSPSSNIGTTALLWVRVISAVAGVCLMGALAVYFLRKRTAQVQLVQGPATTSPAGVNQMPEVGIPTAVASKTDPETADTPFFQLYPVRPPAYAPSFASAPPPE